MRFTIDTEEIKKAGIGKDVFFHVLCLYFHASLTEETFKEANRLGYNTRDSGGYYISGGGREMIEKIFIFSHQRDKRPSSEYKELARGLMDIFPEGGKQGTYSSWRGSVPVIADRLRMLESIAGIKLSPSKVLQAARDYVQSFGTDTLYMRTLYHFIFNIMWEEGFPAQWQSDLLSAIENIKTNETDNQ